MDAQSTVKMHSFFIDMCRACLKGDRKLVEEMSDPDLKENSSCKYVDILRECFPDFVFEEHSACKLCNVCSELLQGTQLLRNRLLESQKLYQQYLSGLKPNCDFAKSEICKLSLQLQPFKKGDVTKATEGSDKDVCEIGSYKRRIPTNDSINDEEESVFNYIMLCPEVRLETAIPIKTECDYEFVSVGKSSECISNAAAEESMQRTATNSASKFGDIGDKIPSTSSQSYANRLPSNSSQEDACDMDQSSFVCKCCNETFDTIESFGDHAPSHEGDELKCKCCDLTFVDFPTLNEHTCKKKLFPCTFCDRQLTTHWNLKQHIRIHTGEKPYKCKHCDKAFTQSAHFKRHALVHTGEKPFKCEYCGKAFTAIGNLILHRHTHTKAPFLRIKMSSEHRKTF